MREPVPGDLRPAGETTPEAGRVHVLCDGGVSLFAPQPRCDHRAAGVLPLRLGPGRLLLTCGTLVGIAEATAT